MSGHQLQEMICTVTDDVAEPMKLDEPALIYNKSIKPHRIVVTANGIKIQSNLNPNAKEFYPSYIKRERLKSGENLYNIKEELEGGKDDNKFEDNNTSEKDVEIIIKQYEEISALKVGKARVENFVLETLDENSCNAETIESSLGFSKFVEIIAADEIKCDLPVADEKTKDSKGGSIKQSERKEEKNCESEVGVKETLHLSRNSAATISKLRSLKDSKDVNFASVKASEAQNNSKEAILMKCPNMELPRFEMNNVPENNEKKSSCTALEDGSDRSTPNSIDLEGDVAQSLLKESVEDVGDHSHKNESGTNLQIQLNHLSKSQTNVKPTITKEILDGMAPPASPTTESYNHNANLSADKRKNLIVDNLKKPKGIKPSTTGTAAIKSTGVVGLKKASIPERPNTSKESTLGAINKDRNRTTAQTKTKTTSADAKSAVTPAAAANSAPVKNSLKARPSINHTKSNSECVKKEGSITSTKVSPTTISKDRSGPLTSRAPSQSSATGKTVNSSLTKNPKKTSIASTPSSLKSKDSSLKSARSVVSSTLRKTDTSKVN
uniref:PAM2 domain-containing protein n=1 Tax=Glossina pallidipes TaxID=7398 RepID=A0A1B0AIT7_GLOPL